MSIKLPLIIWVVLVGTLNADGAFNIQKTEGECVESHPITFYLFPKSAYVMF